MAAGINFEFKLTGNRGAALVTKFKTYSEESTLHDGFEKYVKRHYNSWVELARPYGRDVRPVLVYRVELTSDFAMAAYSYKGISLSAGLNIADPLSTSTSASTWCTWQTQHQYPPWVNHGPQDLAPPPGQVIDTPPPQPTQRTYNQCVFVKYFTGPRGPLSLIPKKIRASAGPHDLGPGDHTGGAFPELAVRSDADSTEGIIEPRIVTDETPDVWFPQYRIVFALNLHPG